MTRPRGAGCRLGRRADNPALVMHRAYQDNATRQPLDLGVPARGVAAANPAPALVYKRRNEVERLSQRLKGFRCIFTRFEKLDALFLGFILFALIVDEAR